jgi:hypothetical protein
MMTPIVPSLPLTVAAQPRPIRPGSMVRQTYVLVVSMAGPHPWAKAPPPRQPHEEAPMIGRCTLGGASAGVGWPGVPGIGGGPGARADHAPPHTRPAGRHR